MKKNKNKNNCNNGKKKVLFASKDLRVGGMEKALVSLLRAFDKESYDVTLVLEKAEGPLLSQLDGQVKIIEYKVSSLGFSPLRKAVNLLRRTAFKMRHGGKYDFSCCYATYSAPCEKIAKIASGNCALYVHSDYVSMYGGNTDKAKEFYDSIGISGYGKVLFVSESGRVGAEKVYPHLKKRFKTVGNLVDADSIESLSRENVDVPDGNGKKVLVFVGRLDDTSKKLKRLLDAVKILSQKRGDFELWIIGKGPDGETYKEYAKSLESDSFVRFLGEITNPYPYIKSADALVLSSDYEGFPVVYSEAAVLGKSIVTTVCASDGFLTVDGTNAYIAEKTAESIAKKITEFFEDSAKKTVSCDYYGMNKSKLEEIYKLTAGE